MQLVRGALPFLGGVEDLRVLIQVVDAGLRLLVLKLQRVLLVDVLGLTIDLRPLILLLGGFGEAAARIVLFHEGRRTHVEIIRHVAEADLRSGGRVGLLPVVKDTGINC